MIFWESFAAVGLLLLAVYLGLGALFAVPFVARGVAAVDANAQGAGWGFRALIFPGVVALWPLLALRWRAARGGRA